MQTAQEYDVVVVGGGPAGATAAQELAEGGHRVLLLERAFRIKPCGGAIPPRAIEDFDIPQHMLVARINSARMIAPSDTSVDMPIDGGYVGMVDRETFDPWLRERAVAAGAELRIGNYQGLEQRPDGRVDLRFRDKRRGQEVVTVTARAVIGADGARSAVARQCIPGGEDPPCVIAYHEILHAPKAGGADYQARRCDVWYQGRLSPDFYAWVFPHGEHCSVGMGTARHDFSLRDSVATLRRATGLDGCETIRREGAPIPLKPLERWDDGRNVLVAGDAAGVVAPASGEGIYYALLGGRIAAGTIAELLVSGDARVLATARQRFMKEHGRVFWVLGMMQRFWYSSDKRRERFVSMCEDPDVQYLTWQAYMHKRLVKARPAAHARIFFKDVGHLLGVVKT